MQLFRSAFREFLVGFSTLDRARIAAKSTGDLSPTSTIGRSAITGVTDQDDTTFSNFNAFKIPQLRGIRDTAPYFHDNSARTLEDVMAHYTNFFNISTGGALILTEEDRADVVAFMKLLR